LVFGDWRNIKRKYFLGKVKKENGIMNKIFWG
jgi:hypothetical protein